MKVITLLENRTISKDYKSTHGLSLYIETENHKILFDTGTNKYFAQNAKKLGVKLAEVDIVIISHGHYDHGGGLEEFLKLNDQAKIYIGKEAFTKHIIKLFGVFKYDIGLKKELSNNKRFIKVDGTLQIDDELLLFNDVRGSHLLPIGNKKLLKVDRRGNIEQDDFNHEINLLIHENGSYTLLCGCAHKGITNIIDRAKELVKNNLKTVIGGFHLMGIKGNNSKEKIFLDDLIENLSSNGIDKYYTCHCTGEKAYGYLSQKMEHLNELKTGMTMEVCKNKSV